jgi:hypothetical protein
MDSALDSGSGSGGSGSSGSSSGSGSGGSGSSASSTVGDGSATVTGTFSGQTLTVQSAVVGISNSPSAGLSDADIINYTDETVIALINLPNTCGMIGATSDSFNAPNTQLLLLVINTASPIMPGTFELAQTTGSISYAEYTASNATCAVASTEQSVSGSIVLSTVTSSELAGSFDVTLSPVNAMGAIVNPSITDRVTGSFSAPVCAAFSTAVVSTGVQYPGSGGMTKAACK